MKIAITGGTGFLGSFLTPLLLENGHEVTILSRKYDDNVTQTDYSLESLTKILEGHDAVVHLAAKRSAQGKKEEFQDNEVLTQKLYDASVANNITNIVYASTISVYSGDDLLPWRETDVPMPALMYGVSKLTCEAIGNLYNMKYGLAVKNLRLAHLYGPSERNNYMINLFFRRAFNKQQLVLHTKSTAKREFLYIKDAAAAILAALLQRNVTGTFNIGSSDALTNEQVAEKINHVFGNNENLLVENPSMEDSIHSSFMSHDKSKTVLNFIPKYSFEEALIEILEDLKEQDHVPEYF